MATAATVSGRAVCGASQAGTCERGESLAERMFSLAVMAGTVGGAGAGALVGSEVGTEYHVAYGTFGTLLGGALAASVLALCSLWTVRPVGNETRTGSATALGSVTPTSRAG